jgi:hypothetical protein
LPFGFHEGKAGRHRAEFVLGEFVGVVAHCSSPEALAFNKRNSLSILALGDSGGLRDLQFRRR